MLKLDIMHRQPLANILKDQDFHLGTGVELFFYKARI